jgi:hypothetical protein
VALGAIGDALSRRSVLHAPTVLRGHFATTGARDRTGKFPQASPAVRSKLRPTHDPSR